MPETVNRMHENFQYGAHLGWAYCFSSNENFKIVNGSITIAPRVP